MKAVVMNGPGGPDRLEYVERPDRVARTLSIQTARCLAACCAAAVRMVRTA